MGGYNNKTIRVLCRVILIRWISHSIPVYYCCVLYVLQVSGVRLRLVVSSLFDPEGWLQRDYDKVHAGSLSDICSQTN